MVRVCLQEEVEGQSMPQVACLCLWEVAEEEEEGEKQEEPGRTQRESQKARRRGP